MLACMCLHIVKQIIGSDERKMRNNDIHIGGTTFLML